MSNIEAPQPKSQTHTVIIDAEKLIGSIDDTNFNYGQIGEELMDRLGQREGWRPSSCVPRPH